MKACFSLCLAVFAFSGAAWAQAISTSQIKGTVQDPSGAAVPGAEIKVTQTDTGALRTAITDTDGSYVLTSLPIGPYRLEVSKEGFAKYVQSGIVLQVATNPTIEITLKVGSVSEQVQVEANTTLVETQSSGVGQVVDMKRVLDLPLIGRQVQDLILTAGAATAGSDGGQLSSRNYPGIQAFSVAGGLATGTSYTLDGSMHNDVYTNSTLPLPFPDALQEFKVETSALPAQYGMHSGAAVNAVTKSGTNQWHGDAFEFVRNYKFNAKQRFAATRDSLKRNQWGGTVGGPIQQNKLFFFAGYQQTDTRQSPSATVTFVPTADMQKGDFTTFASAACQSGKAVTLGDPTNNNQPYAVNNQIPATKLSVPAVNIAKLLPTSTDPCGRTMFGVRTVDDEHFGVAKMDYQLSATHSLFARYLGTHDKQPVPFSFGNNLLATGAGGNGYDDLDQSFTIGDTYLITPRAVNSFRATVDRSAIARVSPEFFGPNDVGINIYSYLPKFTSVSVTGGFSIGNNLTTDATYKTTTLQLGDDLSLIRGNHQMGFGVNISHYNSNTYARVLATPTFTFSGQATGLRQANGTLLTGLGIADFFTGNVASAAQSAPNVLFVRANYIGLYAQDTWKVKSKLTISYGLRWEPFFPMQFANSLVYHFDQAAFIAGTPRSTVFKQAPPGLSYPGDPGFPSKAGLNRQWKQFAPRIGMVWDPNGDGRMSIRASYGIFFDTIPAQYNLNTETAPPWGNRTALSGVDFADPYKNVPGGNPFPVVFDANAPFALNGTFNTFNYDTHMTYVQQWNFSIQRQFGRDWLASASYLGNEMVHLFGTRELNPGVYAAGATVTNLNSRRLFNQLNPTYGKYFGFTDTWDDGGTGSYNGMLLSLQKRFSRGVTVNVNYTWSHCLSNPVNSVPNGGNGGGGVYMFDNSRALDRGNCSTSANDKRHVANMTAVGEVPRFSDKWLTWIASGWKASATVGMATGSYFSVVTGVDNALSGKNSTTQRPNLKSDNVYGDGTAGFYLNRNAFDANLVPGTYGNLGQANILGPGNLNFNAGLARSFRVREGQTVEIRGEGQNVLNRINYGQPTASLASNTFGQINTSGPARIMQFAIKYAF
jgi:hypothetical protein